MPSLLLPLLAIIISVGIFTSGLTIGIKWEEGKQAVAEKQLVAAVDAANKASAEAIANIKVTNKTIQNEVERRIEMNTIYKECKVDPETKALVDAALTSGSHQ